MGAHTTPASSCSCSYQSHRHWGKDPERCGKGGEAVNDNELLDMLEIPEKALVDDIDEIRDDESEESVKVLLRYCGCTEETYGKGGSFDVTESTESYETSGDDNDLIENIEIVKTAEEEAEGKDNDEDDADANETGTEGENNGNLVPSPSGSDNIEIIKTAEAEDNDNADVNEIGTKDDNNRNLLQSPSGHIEIIIPAEDNALMHADENQDNKAEVRDEVENQDDEACDGMNESMDNLKNKSGEGCYNDDIVDEVEKLIHNKLISKYTQPDNTALAPDDDAPLEEEPDNDVPFDEEPKNYVPCDYDEEPNNHVHIDEQLRENTPFDEHPNEGIPGEHQAIPNKSEKKTKNVREYSIRCSNNVNSIHSVRAVEVDMTSKSRRCYPVISPRVRKVALSLHHVQNHPTPTTNCTESRDPENAYHSALSIMADRDDHGSKEVSITAEVREEEKDPVPIATPKASDPLINLEEMDMDMLIKSTRAWLIAENAVREARSETQKAEFKDIETSFQHQSI